VETVRPLVQAREHTLELRLPEQAIPVDADATRLAQVFSNLLTNAAKYTEPGGKLRLGAHVAGNEAIVDIVDNGIGISPDVLPVIFDMFVQADTSLERRQSGLGVGLALAKRLVELHGGRLDAHSEGVNRGSRFTVTLPTSTVREGMPARPPTSTSPRAPSCRILLVDDNVDFVTSLAALLHASGHEVMTAHDGAEAIQVALRFRPQVAFLDIGLPGLNGYDLARRLRALPETAQTLLIAITGWGQEQDKRRAKAAGFDKHFVKPVEFHVIEELLDRCFAEQHGTRE
jgi:CheY-like chemotaxis protein/anti-sigma regulatory factor (Ser/Thr protein kinase)